jgi:myo-inositol-1(or 4)-monophosphatase
MINFEIITEKIEKAVLETAKFISEEALRFDKSRIETKGLHDLVSYVDRSSEKMLVDRLNIVLPEAGFIAEEGTSSKKGGRYCWVIDPLDGTTNFFHGLHPFAISVALTEDGEPVPGVVHSVGGNETFTAFSGGGARLNGHQIHVSSSSSLSDSLVATGFPYYDFTRLGNYMDCLTHLCKTTQGIRRLGSAAIDLAYVACGRFEAFYEYGLNPWDIAAGILLVREAGGRVSDFSGVETKLSGKEVVAANNLIYPEFLENVSKFML